MRFCHANRRRRSTVRLCRRAPCLPAACLLVPCLLAVPAVGQVVIDRPEVRDQQRRNRLAQHQSMQMTVANMQRLDAQRADEVFLFRLQDGNLDVEVPLPEWVARRGGQFRVEVPELPGPTYVHLANVPAFHRFGGRLDAARPDVNLPGAGLPGARGRDAAPRPVGSMQTFVLAHTALSDLGTLTSLGVQSRPGSFSLDHTTQSDDGHRMVRLVQQQDPIVPGDDPRAGGGGAIQLWVNAYGGGRIRPLNLNLVAADFPALVRQHPREVEAHVRPLFARLGQEQVFAPDPYAAWQVLADYWSADGAIGRQVAGLLPDLDHPDFRVRERALERLVNLDRAGATVLLRLDRAGFSPSRHLMIDRALARYGQLPRAETARLRNDRGFLLDCLYSDDRGVRAAALQHLRKLTGRGDLRFDPDAPAAADRFAAVRALRQSLLARPATQRAATRPAKL